MKAPRIVGKMTDFWKHVLGTCSVSNMCLNNNSSFSLNKYFSLQMAYELLSQSRKYNKLGGPNKSRGVGKSFEKKNKRRRGRLFGTRPRVNPCAQVSSIQNSERIKTVKTSLDNRTRKNAAAKVITTFLALIVTLNNVVFNCKYYF